MSDIAISVDNLGKLYRIGAKSERYKTLRDTLANLVIAPIERARSIVRSGNTRSRDDQSFWALKDVCFDIKQGEVVGVIGRNGAGKSTLLKILSRIMEPTEGTAEIRGRVGSLLEVGTGFHPELTGRENIYLNGAILGMKRFEIEQKFDEIVEFAEIEKFLDTAVKHYSSGMYLRLAFAVAAHLEPEILLVDEVLAVGDASFRKKCLGKMGEVAKEGRTVLFVSHDMGSVGSLCQSGIYLTQGALEYYGPVDECISRYTKTSSIASSYQRDSESAKRAFVQFVKVVEPVTVASGESIEIEAGVFSRDAFRFSLDWRIRSELGTPIAWGCPHMQLAQTELLVPGLNRFRFKIGPLPLSEGTYKISIDVDVPNIEYIERIEDCIEFQIGSCVMGSPISIKSTWNKGPVILPFEWTNLTSE